MKLKPRLLPALCALLTLLGCAGDRQGTRLGTIFLELEEPLQVPANRAHTKFQRGRQARGVNRYDPWCELEIDRVSEQPQRVETGRFRVRRVGQAFIKDYNTRISAVLAGFSCDDLVFMETTLWVDRRTSPQIRHLRCFAPYTHCRFGPPLSLRQIQSVTGQGLIVGATRVVPAPAAAQ